MLSVGQEPSGVYSLNVHTLFTGEAVKSHQGEGIGTAVEVTTVVMYNMCTIAETSKVGSNTFATVDFFFKVVLYGYSPVPKYCMLIPVNTSNSVLAVPAPTTGTFK